ncbi:ATPase [Synechococcus sp. GFB01]|nr:ATPase [Synechococcus sp. GFB01]
MGWLRRRRRPAELPSARQLLSLMDAAPTGWILLDPLGQVRHVNPRAEQLLASNIALPADGLPLESLCSDAELAACVAIARRQDRPQRLEWRYRDEDLDVRVVPTSGGWLGVQLQTRRSLEAQLEQQERWVSDVAHELKTPLTALLLVGDSLAARVNSGNAHLVERLQRELKRLQELVGDLLELSRLENTLPGSGLRLSTVDLPDLVQQVWAGLRPLAEQRGIVLEVLASPGLAIQADRSRMHRALLNLLDNALRYSPDGEPVQVSFASSVGWMLVVVRDRGAGFSDEDLEHMFERFYRGDPARVRSPRAGSGLGLAIVQQIALSHGGRVQARNDPDGGAVVELLLPLHLQSLQPLSGLQGPA